MIIRSRSLCQEGINTTQTFSTGQLLVVYVNVTPRKSSVFSDTVMCGSQSEGQLANGPIECSLLLNGARDHNVSSIWPYQSRSSKTSISSTYFETKRLLHEDVLSNTSATRQCLVCMLFCNNVMRTI